MEVVFFGGEPLLNQQAIFKIVDYIENELKAKHTNIRFHYHITTNLTILNQKLIDIFKRYKFTILTDVDGRRNEHDITRPFVSGKSSYNITINNIQKLINNGIHVSVRCTVTSVNVHNLSQIYEDFKSKGFLFQSYPMLMPADSDCNLVNPKLFPDEAPYVSFVRDKLIDSLREKIYLAPISDVVEQVIFLNTQHFGCGMPMGFTAVVDAKGLVYPCIYLVGNEKYKLGSIFNDNPFDFSYPHLNVDDIKYCHDCKLRYMCGGGCPLSEVLVKDISNEALDYFHRISCSLAWASFEEACWALVNGVVNKNTFKKYNSIC